MTPVKYTFISRGGFDVLVQLDALESESADHDVEVTDHPVEVGADVSDHARVKPIMLSVQGIISNTPVNRTQQRRVIQTQGFTIQSTAVNGAPAGATGYAEAALERLTTLKEARQLVSVVTPSRVYKDMLLTSMKVPRDAKTGDAVRVALTFKEIRFAEVQRLSRKVAEPKGNKKANVGKVPAVPTPPAQERSHLLQIGDAFSGSAKATDNFISDKLSPAGVAGLVH